MQRLTLAALIAALMLSPTATARDVTVVLLETSFGAIEIEMLDLDAPLTVQNFLNYVSGGDYDNTIIHRSVPGFVLQGGGWFLSPHKARWTGSLQIHLS